MKTPILIIMSLAVISLASCKKQYSCECVTKVSIAGVALSSQTTSESITKKMSKKTGESSCNNTKAILEKQIKAAIDPSMTSEVSCALK